MAGGRGTRGRPYTEYFPKAMTPVSDRPLIDYIIRYIGAFELVDQIIVITDLNGLGGQIRNYYGADSQSYDSDRIAFVQDSGSGTGGDLLHASGMIPNSEPFILWFADNLCAVDLAGMHRQFVAKGSLACIATRRERAEETGFAIVGDDGVVQKFVEKPVVRLPSSECLGVYVLGSEVLSRISDMVADCRSGAGGAGDCKEGAGGNGRPGGTQVNLSHDILQDLSEEGAVSAFDIGGAQWLDVESPAILERNKSRVDDIISAMSGAASARQAGRSRP